MGFDVDLDEYTADALKNAPHVLRDFYKANPELPGPPQNLDYWLECAKKDEWPEERSGDN